MHVLHLHWLPPTKPEQNGRLFLWAETADSPQPNRDRRKKSAQPHPFAAGSADLRSLLSNTSWQGKEQTDSLTFWLPTNRFGPVPSLPPVPPSAPASPRCSILPAASAPGNAP